MVRVGGWARFVHVAYMISVEGEGALTPQAHACTSGAFAQHAARWARLGRELVLRIRRDVRQRRHDHLMHAPDAVSESLEKIHSDEIATRAGGGDEGADDGLGLRRRGDGDAVAGVGGKRVRAWRLLRAGRGGRQHTRSAGEHVSLTLRCVSTMRDSMEATLGRTFCWRASMIAACSN